MRKRFHSFMAVAGAALMVSLLCVTVGNAQQVKAAAPGAAPAGAAAEVKAPPATTPPVGVPGVPTKGAAVKEGQKPVQWAGCTSACPHCLRSCELNVGHYSSHMCSDGHTWN
jgi:hypothetical protein